MKTPKMVLEIPADYPDARPATNPLAQLDAVQLERAAAAHLLAAWRTTADATLAGMKMGPWGMGFTYGTGVVGGASLGAALGVGAVQLAGVGVAVAAGAGALVAMLAWRRAMRQRPDPAQFQAILAEMRRRVSE